MQIQYCITHESWGMEEREGCIFTSCPPPDDQRPNWDSMDEPSPEELDEMNQNAEILLDELLNVE